MNMRAAIQGAFYKITAPILVRLDADSIDTLIKALPQVALASFQVSSSMILSEQFISENWRRLLPNIAVDYDKRLNEYNLSLAKAAEREKEYYDKLHKLLSEIPKEFSEYVESEAWNRGHSDGYEECLIIAENIVLGLAPAIEAYTKRVKSEM